MPATLRKRKEAPQDTAVPAKKPASAKKDPISKAVESVKEKANKATESKEPATASGSNGGGKSAPVVGDTLDVASFGGDFETQDGKKVTLKELLDDSTAGVVFFTYPKASTPGCTKQACLFRDGYSTLTASGLAIYGLSGDSPKANTTFKTKQNLPFDLLCNPSYSLISAIGMQKKPAKSTKRGVVVIDKSGKVLVAQEGGPQATVDAVKEAVDKMGLGTANGKHDLKANEDKEAAQTAIDVADASKAAHLDESTPKVGTPA